MGPDDLAASAGGGRRAAADGILAYFPVITASTPQPVREEAVFYELYVTGGKGKDPASRQVMVGEFFWVLKVLR